MYPVANIARSSHLVWLAFVRHLIAELGADPRRAIRCAANKTAE